jgi:hypothetical protein
MAFAPLVAFGFFLVLWFRPYVFYPPADFAHVDVAAYVAAMRNSSIVSGDKLYSQVEQAVRSVLSSEGTLSSFAQIIDDKDHLAYENLSRALQNFATETVEKIRKAGFVTVDSRPLDKNRGSRLQIPYDQSLRVDEFLDRVYFAINKNSAIADSLLMPFTYAKAWILRDRDSGKVFDKIGTIWAWQEGKQTDNRYAVDVGISAGMLLEAVRLDTTSPATQTSVTPK